MKKSILIVMFVLPCLLFGQNIEPQQVKFFFQSDSIYLSADMDYFKQSKFLLGWHWNHYGRMTKAMGMNQAHAHDNYNYIISKNNDKS